MPAVLSAGMFSNQKKGDEEYDQTERQIISLSIHTARIPVSFYMADSPHAFCAEYQSAELEYHAECTETMGRIVQLQSDSGGFPVLAFIEEHLCLRTGHGYRADDPWAAGCTADR